jgi:hypothetical protein
MHLDGVRTVNNTTATWQEDTVMITTILRHRSIGISSFFWPERDEPFASFHIAGKIDSDEYRQTFNGFCDWRDLDRAQRLRTCVIEHAQALVGALEEMGIDATFEVDETTLQRFALAALSWEQ